MGRLANLWEKNLAGRRDTGEGVDGKFMKKRKLAERRNTSLWVEGEIGGLPGGIAPCRNGGEIDGRCVGVAARLEALHHVGMVERLMDAVLELRLALRHYTMSGWWRE
jgi:hypothetical protein